MDKPVDKLIDDLGPEVSNVWKGMRPVTRKLLAGAINSGGSAPAPAGRFFFDAHADWELSKLLTALDDESWDEGSGPNVAPMRELAEICARVLESCSGSAEVFIQLADRALAKHDYEQLERLADSLMERYSASEIAEVIRQTDLPHIRALAAETLVTFPAETLAELLKDPLYSGIAVALLERKYFEFGSEEARVALENYFDAGN